ncbi:MAG: ABC transporter permease [Gammaproteobacteria bacterium]
MIHAFLNVLHKEWLDAFRDRRSIGVSLAFAVFGPAFLYLMLNNLAVEAASEDDLKVAVVGAANAPTLVTHLEQNGMDLVNAIDAQAARAMLGTDASVMLSIPTDYAARYLRRDRVNLSIYGNFKDPIAQAQAQSLQRQIEGFGQNVTRSRLIAEGVSPVRIQTLTAQTFDLSTAGGKSANITNALIYVFLIAGFVSGAFMTADSVAGERERHSLEPLLAQPLSPMALTLGKWVACSAVSVVVSTVTIVVGGILLNRVALADLGLRLHLDPQSIALGAITLAPLALFAVALQMMMASRAKTYREAGIYGQLTMFLPVAVAGSLMIGNVEFGGLTTSMPLTGQTLLLRDIFLEGTASLITIASVSISTLVAAAIMLTLTSRWFSDESRL